jgi:hypothetical protein
MICWRKALLAGVLLMTMSLMLLVNGGCSILRRLPASTPTPTKTPVSASLPEPTPTFTPAVPSPTPTPERSYDHCPLTGLEMADPTLAMRRPLDIKIDNYPGSRPPSGIHRADVVFEHFAEGAITRLSAVFLCQDAEAVGPVRSARLIDVEHVVDMFDGVLVHYGAANRVLPMIRAAGFPDMDGYFGASGFFNAPGRVSPFNKYCGTPALWEAVEEHGWQRPAERPGFPFSESVESDVQASQIAVIYAPQNRARWDYDAERGLYLRYADDQPHIEESTGEQLTSANVAVVQATHTVTDIDEGYGSFSVRIDLLGEGPAMVFRSGTALEGRWVREGEMDMIRFLDEAGNPIPFTLGNVWIQVVPNMDVVESD